MSSPERPEWLQPGSIIELADSSQLAEFEDAIVPYVDPEYNIETWQGRPALKDLLRPSKFYGRIGNIVLSVMLEPYEQLLSARDRGLSVGRGTLEATTPSSIALIDSYVGFKFYATSTSSRPGLQAGIQAELWYAPVPFRNRTEQRPGMRPNAKETKNQRYGGQAVRRYVSKPTFEAELFIEHDIRARRVGLDVLQEAIRHPLRGGLPQ